ncbi:uncharacterized protein [Dysidea avara]|uniref:uncharacterized protein n=1 Tax=Dysidea avara TaxID=196820 RepID=UPI00332485B3
MAVSLNSTEDLKLLRPDEFSHWLKEKGYSDEVCQAFEDEEVDGEAFMTLTESDFKDLAKKIGIVRKLLALQEKVTRKPESSNNVDYGISLVSTKNVDSPPSHHPPPIKPRRRPPAATPQYTNTEKEMLPSTKHRSDSASLLDEYAGSTISRLAHKFSNLDVIDVKELNTDDFVEWLKAKGFSLEHCQAFKDNNVDGDTFLMLDKQELSHIVKGVGTVKKLEILIARETQKNVKLDDTVSHPLIPASSNKLEDLSKKMTAKAENDNISSSLALKMKNESTLLSNPQSKIAAYKLPMKMIMVNQNKGVAKYVIGTPIPGQLVIEKVLMVVGVTGAGKTTLINGMINYLFGVKWKDDFRLVLIAEDSAKSQAHSQTALITVYKIYPSQGSQFEYTLTIIDTPGFGDTTGLERNKQIIQQIQNFFSVQGENGLDHLDGIGFVTQASLARLTAQQNYVYHSILSVFGSDVYLNIFIMVTFADGQDPPVIAAIEEAKIECSTYYKFNNSALFACNKHIKISDEDENEEENFDEMFWKMGFLFLKKFFKAFYSKIGVSLYLTMEVLRERKQLETTVQALQQQIRAGCAKLEELRQEEIVLQQREAEIATNKDFTYSVDIEKQRNMVQQINYYLQTVENDVVFKVEELQRGLQRLDKIALKQSPLTQVQHMSLLIEAEKQQANPGFLQRIKIYELAKQEAEILEKAKHNPESLRIRREKEEIRELNKKHQKSRFNPLRYW